MKLKEAQNDLKSGKTSINIANEDSDSEDSDEVSVDLSAIDEAEL